MADRELPAMQEGRETGPLLAVERLNVFYGRAHVLQDISLVLDRGVLAVVGRNGMGKTTLCNAITGLIPGRGSIRLRGQEILGLTPNKITGRGIAYVPQGRRVWPSLSVDEHLRLAYRDKRGPWTIQRIYELFPRLAERRRNGGMQLSGGEQQMLAIGRALLLHPQLLVMDEPTEGLAPVIVEQVSQMLKRLTSDGSIAVLLIEQNLGVAIDVADRIAVLVNGRIAQILPASTLAEDPDLQRRLLGVSVAAEEEEEKEEEEERASIPVAQGPVASDQHTTRVFTIRRHADESLDPGASKMGGGEARRVRGLTRWNAADPGTRAFDRVLGPRDLLLDTVARTEPRDLPGPVDSQRFESHREDARVLAFPVAVTSARAAYIAGTFDTKGRELLYLRDCLEKLGLRTVTVDLSTSSKPSSAMVHPREVARHHPQGERAVFTGDRGSAVAAMAQAFERFLGSRRDVGGIISAGGSGGTALATQAMRGLPIGVPKMMVSTVASGDVKPYVGPADICMMYSVTDVSGINRISERVLANAAHALAGMITHQRAHEQSAAKPAVGLTMFGVTTPCVQAVTQALEDRYDCIVFHATGTGGQSMEKLVDSGLLEAVIDITTTEIADEIVGGVMPGGPARMESIVRTRIPYVASCGALDMVNFWAMDSVPARFRDRKLYAHNPNVTLMRTTPAECTQIGRFIADKLNRMEGPVRFLIPDGGVSLLDLPGKPFWDPLADKALFDAIASGFLETAARKLVRVPAGLNDPEFASALILAFNEVTRLQASRPLARHS